MRAAWNRGMSVRRDPFARGELVRFTLSGGGECAWCGQDRARLYGYLWEGDDRPLRTYETPEAAFCGLGCHDSYCN